MSKNFSTFINKYFLIISIFIIIISIFFIPFLSGNNSGVIITASTEQSDFKIITSSEFCWPLPGYTRISSYFGYRNAPTVGATSFHGGIDIPAPAGTNIISAVSGKVTKTGFMGSGGCSVVVQCNNYTIIFHHVSPNFLVQAGDYVSQGQIIAQVGPKNIYGFSNNVYKDANRKSHKWCYYWTSFTLYNKER